MIHTLKQLLTMSFSVPPIAEVSQHELDLATTALLVEVCRADFEIQLGEMAMLQSLASDMFQVEKTELEDILSLAESKADAATSLSRFTSLLDKSLSKKDKVGIIEMMWKVALADGNIDKYEEHLVRKVADLLHVPHSAYIRAKHKVLES